MSAPAAANVSASRSGIVSIVGPLIDAEPLLGEHTCPPARHRFALEHGDLVTAPHQLRGRRQPAEPGADHDDAHVRSPAG